MAAQDVRYHLNGLMLLVEGKELVPWRPMGIGWRLPALRSRQNYRARR
jgi:hypothetical protein